MTEGFQSRQGCAFVLCPYTSVCLITHIRLIIRVGQAANQSRSSCENDYMSHIFVAFCQLSYRLTPLPSKCRSCCSQTHFVAVQCYHQKLDQSELWDGWSGWNRYLESKRQTGHVPHRARQLRLLVWRTGSCFVERRLLYVAERHLSILIYLLCIQAVFSISLGTIVSNWSERSFRSPTY